ncbi:MarR family winged helix-turn-helix transcriptional regulator [Nocardia arthritidis]|uniref:MarR family transcriptional regulator n=1 Tax=Nocardia arthritidis TaxID=228602 RepID=A0A6G9YKC8_9NOCA|nr:MarR family winged helix-turn-helix transcriptional regulator [Nocardia arthritidis]QIS13610.1 MarR family transcriptional regulator [Nocardia arthritidis]
MDTAPIPGVVRLINRAARALARDGDAALKPFGMRYAQVPVLALLRAGAEPTQKELVEATGIEQSSMAQLLTRMERDGLIRRVPNPRDARSQTIALAAETAERVTTARRQLDDLNERAVAGFTPEEIRLLEQLLIRLNDNLDKQNAGSGNSTR